MIVMAVVLSGCDLLIGGFTITEAASSLKIDGEYCPVEAMDVFPPDTSKVYVCVRFRGAPKDGKLTFRWFYTGREEYLIDTQVQKVAGPEGRAYSALVMAQGKFLPPGSYRVEIIAGDELQENVIFIVEQGKEFDLSNIG